MFMTGKMNALKVNVKQLYQRPALWLWYAIVVCWVMFAIAEPFLKKKPGGVTADLIIILLAGVLIGNLQKEVLTKPFAFCLPGHRRMPVLFIVLMGVIVSGVYSIIFIRYPGLAITARVFAVCSSFFMGLTVYSVAVLTMFMGRQGGRFIGFVPVCVFAITSFNGPILIERIIVQLPFIPIVMGLASFAFLVTYLKREDFTRNLCGTQSVTLFDSFNMTKQKKFREAEKVRTLGARTEAHSKFLFNRIKSFKFLSISRYVTGILYADLSRFKDLSLRGVNPLIHIFYLILFVLFLFYFGYFPYRIVDLILVIPVIWALFYTPPVQSSLLLPGGRKEQCRSIFASIVCRCLIFSSYALSYALLFFLLEKFMPDIHVADKKLTFQMINLKLAYVPVLVMPIGFLIRFMIGAKTMFTAVFMMLFFIPAVFLLPHLESISVVRIVGTILALWLILAAYIGYYFRTKCLVGKNSI